MHHCHAHGCDVPVPPKLFMCPMHWRQVPQKLAAAVWREYRPGQERDKRPSLRYLAVQQLAIAYVAFDPNDEEAKKASLEYLTSACIYDMRANDAGDGRPIEDLLRLVEQLHGQ